MNDILQSQGLTKYYGNIRGIENITLSVKKGEIFGFLGPNGAGKTTMIRTLLGFLKPSNGAAYIFGLNIRENGLLIKKDIGYVPGKLNIYPLMTGEQFLNYFNGLRGYNAYLFDELMELFTLPLNRKIKSYSQGMIQQLGIIQAFMHDPEFIIFDEPTSGLDPFLKQRFYEFLIRKKKEGKTFFISSHLLSEVDKICDRVGIIRNGTLATLEKIESLKQKKGKKIRIKIKEEPTAFPGPPDMNVDKGYIEFTATDIDHWLKILATFTILDVDISDFGLEDIFVRYYKD